MVKRTTWDNEDIANFESTERYKAEKGRTDIIHVLDDPVVYQTHYFPHKGQNGLFITCSEADDCPACAKGNKSSEKYGCTIVHLREKKKKKVVEVDEIKIWTFGADKFRQLRELKNTYGSIRKHDIIVTCTKTDFQEVNMLLNTEEKPLLTKDIIKLYKEEYTDTLEEFLDMTPDRIEKLLDDDSTNSGDDAGDDDSSGDDDAKSSKNSGKDSKKDEGGDLDDFEKELEDEFGDLSE